MCFGMEKLLTHWLMTKKQEHKKFKQSFNGRRTCYYGTSWCGNMSQEMISSHACRNYHQISKGLGLRKICLSKSVNSSKLIDHWVPHIKSHIARDLLQRCVGFNA